jgi:hypothetical protein
MARQTEFGFVDDVPNGRHDNNNDKQHPGHRAPENRFAEVLLVKKFSE